MFISLLKTHHWSCLHLYMSTTTTHKFISRLKIHHWSCLHLYMTSRSLYFWVADFGADGHQGTSTHPRLYAISSLKIGEKWISLPVPDCFPKFRNYLKPHELIFSDEKINSCGNWKPLKRKLFNFEIETPKMN